MSEDYSKCPECGSETEYDWACPKCGWDHGEDGGRINGQENTRGW
jgi:hypothetical protein